MLDQITPVILTYNEAPNIGRTLSRLDWAQDIVVVDSYSDDGTQEIVATFSNVRLIERSFDSHSRQWNYAIENTNINTEWVLALDADYLITQEFVNELNKINLDRNIVGYRATFRFYVDGIPLRGSLYPPVIVLFQVSRAHYRQDGHTQRLILDGSIADLSSTIVHDDRKPLDQWLFAQSRYMTLEAKKIQNSKTEDLDWSDKIRKLLVLAPILVFFYCLTIKKGVFDGRAGLYYALQRTLSEIILSLCLLKESKRVQDSHD